MTQSDQPTKSVHIVLGTTPGSGKTTVTRLIAECLIRKGGAEPMCIDTSLWNEGLSRVTALPVQEFSLIEPGGEFSTRRLDELVDVIVEEDRSTVIDTGVEGFRTLTGHLAHFHMIDVLSEAGFEVCLHSVLAGEDLMTSSLTDLIHVQRNVRTKAGHVVWLNSLSEDTEFDGRRFEEGRVSKSFARDVSSVVRIGRMDDMPFGDDFAALLRAKLTFAEALTPCSELPILKKRRLAELAEVTFLNIEKGIAFGTSKSA